MKYKEQLKTQEWKALRQLVLEDRGFKCEECSAENNLHIHHTFYESGKKCWEYAIKDLQVLCKDCHENWHRHNKIKIVRKYTKPIRKSFKEKVSDYPMLMWYGIIHLHYKVDTGGIIPDDMIEMYNKSLNLIEDGFRKRDDAETERKNKRRKKSDASKKKDFS